MGFWRLRNLDVNLPKALHPGQYLAHPWPCQGFSQGWGERRKEVADGTVELVFELYPLDGIQTTLWDYGGKVVDDGKIKEAESIFPVGSVNGFTVAVIMSEGEEAAEKHVNTDIFLQVNANDNRPPGLTCPVSFKGGPLLVVRESSL